jgi:hypothetical protein
MIPHLTINPPVRCLSRDERTGSLVVSWPFSRKSSIVLFQVLVLLVKEQKDTSLGLRFVRVCTNAEVS